MKILIKDDCGIFRIGICALIRENLNEIHPVECDETTNLFEKIVSSKCEVAIINFRAKPSDAFTQLHLFRQSFPGLPVVVMDFDAQKHDAGYNCANTFFLNSNCTLDELTACIEKAAGRSISRQLYE